MLSTRPLRRWYTRLRSSQDFFSPPQARRLGMYVVVVVWGALIVFVVSHRGSDVRARTPSLPLDRRVSSRPRALPHVLRVSAHLHDLPVDRCVRAFERDAPFLFDCGLAPWLDLHVRRVCGLDSRLVVGFAKLPPPTLVVVIAADGLCALLDPSQRPRLDLLDPLLAPSRPRALRLVGRLCRYLWTTFIVARRVCRVS
jgi:hypothetical protein